MKKVIVLTVIAVFVGACSCQKNPQTTSSQVTKNASADSSSAISYPIGSDTTKAE